VQLQLLHETCFFAPGAHSFVQVFSSQVQTFFMHTQRRQPSSALPIAPSSPQC
jgi:hypothetical protein